MEFYTYLWLRYDGIPYYVGKGRGNRAYDNGGRMVHAPVDKERILIQEFPSEEAALAAEKFLVAYYGRLDIGTGCLRNRTDGGDGVSGGHWKLSEEWCRKQGERKKGNQVRLGSHHSLETREKMRQAKLGKAKSMTACANMRRAHREKREYSKIFTLEVRQRMSEAAKKRVLRDGMACLIARSIRVPRYVGTKESYHAQ